MPSPYRGVTANSMSEEKGHEKADLHMRKTKGMTYAQELHEPESSCGINCRDTFGCRWRSTVAMSNASAYTDSNKVHNCWGRYYNTDFDNTDFDQMCGSGGAGATGNCKTTAPCDFEGDNSLTVYRNRGNTTYDGPDCTFDVETGQTYYF